MCPIPQSMMRAYCKIEHISRDVKSVGYDWMYLPILNAHHFGFTVVNPLGQLDYVHITIYAMYIDGKFCAATDPYGFRKGPLTQAERSKWLEVLRKKKSNNVNSTDVAVI
jgi:hypothetical protein